MPSRKGSEDDRFWRTFWRDLPGASVDRQIQLANRVIQQRGDFNGEAAFSLVETLLDPLRRAGRTEAIDGIVERIRKLRPKAYAEESHWMAFWRAENAALRADVDLAEPLAALLERPDRSIDEFFRLTERLRYHGQVKDLAPAMLEALPKVESSPEITEDGKWQFNEVAFALLLHEHLERNPRLRPDDAAFLRATAPVRDMEEEWLERIVVHASGRAKRQWQRGDFMSRDKNAFGENLFLLTSEFGLALHQRWGWPRSRAEMGRETINKYLAGREAERMRTGGRGRSRRATGYPLLPDPDSAERFMVARLGFLGSQPYQVAVFCPALPHWLRFAADRRLIWVKEASSVHDALRKHARDLSRVLDQYVYDPVMVRDVQRAAELPLE